MKPFVVSLIAIGQWSMVGLIAFTWLIFVPGTAIVLVARLALQ
jgi:hypothetical protein